MLRLGSIFLVLLLSALPAQARLTLSAPAQVGIGLPFLVEIENCANPSSLRISWQDTAFTVEPGGQKICRLLLATDVLKTSPGSADLRVKIAGEPELSQKITITARAFPTQYLTVKKGMVTPPKNVQTRIDREYRQARKVLGQVSPVNHLQLPFVRPVSGEVSSPYGVQRFFNGKKRNPHRGLDLRGAEGTPVQAAAAGTVVIAADRYYGGQSVFLDHGWGVFTLYMHLSQMLVEPGQMVEAGQVIGKIGSTGRVTGPHLHFGLSILDLSADPSPFFFNAQNRTSVQESL